MIEPDEQLRSEIGPPVPDVHGRPVTCRVDELLSHPSYVRNGLTVSASQLSALVDLGDLAFRDPIIITRDRFIVDGYGRLALARQQGRLTIRCIECDLTEQQALRYLLQKHRRSDGWNAFTRISLALDLEPGLKEKARLNQRLGGQNKGLSNLTNPARVNVRSEIAAAAGVRPTNVGKVNHLFRTAIPNLLQALRNGEVSIHRASQWSKLPRRQQMEKLSSYRNERSVKKTIGGLLSRHRTKDLPTVPDPGCLLTRLSTFNSAEPDAVSVVVIKHPGKTLYVSEELLQSLPPHQEVIPE